MHHSACNAPACLNDRLSVSTISGQRDRTVANLTSGLGALAIAENPLDPKPNTWSDCNELLTEDRYYTAVPGHIWLSREQHDPNDYNACDIFLMVLNGMSGDHRAGEESNIGRLSIVYHQPGSRHFIDERPALNHLEAHCKDVKALIGIPSYLFEGVINVSHEADPSSFYVGVEEEAPQSDGWPDTGAIITSGTMLGDTSMPGDAAVQWNGPQQEILSIEES